MQEFTVSAQQSWSATLPWGGGHTVETDPTRRGWRIRAVSHQLAVLGRTGVPGCMSVMPCMVNRSSNNPEGVPGFDVAFYDTEKPEDVFQSLRDRSEGPGADAFQQTPDHSGWALPFVEEIERMQPDGRL